MTIEVKNIVKRFGEFTALDKVDLKVEPSWSYRTWGYSTLRAGDQTGELVVEVRDDAGVISTARLPISKLEPAKPLDPKPASHHD